MQAADFRAFFYLCMVGTMTGKYISSLYVDFLNGLIRPVCAAITRGDEDRPLLRTPIKKPEGGGAAISKCSAVRLPPILATRSPSENETHGANETQKRNCPQSFPCQSEFRQRLSPHRANKVLLENRSII